MTITKEDLDALERRLRHFILDCFHEFKKSARNTPEEREHQQHFALHVCMCAEGTGHDWTLQIPRSANSPESNWMCRYCYLFITAVNKPLPTFVPQELRQLASP